MVPQNRATASGPSYSKGIGGIDMKTSSVSRATSPSTSADSYALTQVRLLAEAPCKQVIDVLGDVAAAAVADSDKRRKLAYLRVWLLVCADQRAEQLQGALCLFLAEIADKQLQPLPRCHVSSLTASAVTAGLEITRRAVRSGSPALPFAIPAAQ
jgi:hypothetical protein